LTASPVINVMPFSSYHSRLLMTISSTLLSPASTLESMMRL
jgi:hypothetical protein